MKRPLPLKFFLVTIITPFFLFPTTGSADCKVDQVTISLTMIDKPLREILKDIERQTKYTIKIDDPKVLDDKKSIILNQSPLSQSLRRLLKDINYSTICNDEQKTLTLVLLDKKSISSSASARDNSTQDNIDEPQVFDMNGIASAFEGYNNKDTKVDRGPQEATSMDGATEAFNQYKMKDIQEDSGPQEITSMDGVTEAFDQYKKKDMQADSGPQEKTSMDGATEAFENYRNKGSRQAIPESQQEETSLDGVDAAFKEYRRSQDSH